MMMVAVALVAALVQPPPMVSKASPMVPSMKTIDKGDQSNMDDAKQIAVKTEAEWQQLWQQHSPDRPRPSVDFTKEMVVGVFLGSRPTAGYGLEIVSATEAGGTIVVRYKQTAPSRGMMTAQVLTSPYHIVTMPYYPGAVKFEKAEP